MVDIALPNGLKLSTCHHLYIHGMAATGTTIADIKRKKKKLTKVLSTKLSIEDYNLFQILTNNAYRLGIIEEPKPSKFLRFLVTYSFNELRNKPELNS